MKEKELISFKLQSYLSLIPCFGFLIVWLMGMFNIYNYKKNLLYVVLYYFITLIPIILFSGIAVLILMFYISHQDNITLKLILSLILCFIIGLSWAIACIGIQKGMIEKFRKEEQKKLETILS